THEEDTALARLTAATLLLPPLTERAEMSANLSNLSPSDIAEMVRGLRATLDQEIATFAGLLRTLPFAPLVDFLRQVVAHALAYYDYGRLTRA
ncbi:MAG TPA: hypothetical protein VKQ36_04370, partial [Ktedonobacterales bacterium]|nr:hypothetical protein [Ktedonobacterales bacterium]